MKLLIKLKRHLTTEERVFIVENYIETESFTTVQSKFRLTFNGKSLCKKSIQNSVTKYRKFGKSLNRKKKDENQHQLMKMLTVRALLENSAKKSVRWNRLGLSAASFNRITCKVYCGSNLRRLRVKKD